MHFKVYQLNALFEFDQHGHRGFKHGNFRDVNNQNMACHVPPCFSLLLVAGCDHGKKPVKLAAWFPVGFGVSSFKPLACA